MHTTSGTRFRYFHNGDFSGDVQIADKDTGETLLTVPFADLALLVAERIRLDRISDLESASVKEVLGVRTRWAKVKQPGAHNAHDKSRQGVRA